MSKRAKSQTRDQDAALKHGERPEHVDEDEAGPFEDDYEDEFEEEDEILEAGVDGRPDVEREAEESMEQMQIDNQTFIPGRNMLSAGEILEPDETAYEMLHLLEPPWPCLSFDLIRDHLGTGRARKKYPAVIYSVAGTQAASGHEKENEIMVMKMSKLSRTERPEDDSDDSDASDDEDEDDDEAPDPILETKRIKLNTSTNRIRASQPPPSDLPQTFASTFTAAMTESGAVLIHDVTPHLTSFDTPGTFITPQQNQPIHTIKAHKSEGFALDWSPQHSPRRLLTGDTDGIIHLTTQNTADGTWSTDVSRPFMGHTSSVEELQWSPNEPNVFASASADGTIRVWDIRSKARKPAITVKASDTDVNVLSWSRQTNQLLASGADDGTWAVWDLRAWKPSVQKGKIGPGGSQQHSPIASFSFHKEQITSVEWHPNDDSIVCVCAGDNTITLWDLAVELDDEESKFTADVKDVPPQLLFVHYMEQVKEAHWHPQIPGAVMATGGSGFGVFKTISV